MYFIFLSCFYKTYNPLSLFFFFSINSLSEINSHLSIKNVRVSGFSYIHRSCVSIAIIKFRTLLYCPKETHVPIIQSIAPPIPQSLTISNLFFV